MNLMKLKNWKKEFYKRLNEDWFVKDGVVSRGVKQFIKDFGNDLLDELKSETTHKYCDAYEHGISCQKEMGADEQKRKTNLKIKSLRELLK